jgi:hypothetical protein
MIVLRHRPGIASVAVLAGITAALGLAHAVAPEWSHAAGLDVWNVSEAEADHRAEVDRHAALDDRHADLRVKVGLARCLTEQLIDGRVSLADAAAEVLRANRSRPEFLFVLRQEYPDAATDRELAARYLLAKVADYFHDEPSRRAEATGRLEVEYQAMRGAN